MIFVSYRRVDSQDVTDRICEHLRSRLGPGKIVRDIDTMPLGIRWLDYVRQKIQECSVFLAIIGPDWCRVADEESGGKRLESPTDPIRLELEAAIEAQVRIIPVFVKRAPFPKPSELPRDLTWILDYGGTDVRPDPDFSHDIERLIKGLGEGFSDERRDGETAVSGVAPLSDLQSQIEISTDEVRNFSESVRRSYQMYEAENSVLNDPAQIYVELQCQPQHDGDAPPTEALTYLQNGLDDAKAQLVLASYGMGKSYMALKLHQRLLDRYLDEPTLHRIPVLMPLKGHRLPRSDPDAILKKLRGFLLEHGLPVHREGAFERLLQAGRLCVIFDGVDEMPLVQTEDDPRRIAEVLDRLDLRRYGNCPWIAMSRTGLFAAALPQLLHERTYRLAYLLSWGKHQWRTYVYGCSAKFRIFETDEARESFLAAVERMHQLTELTATPLLARMLVESWRTIVRHPEEVNLIRLYGHYADYVLSSKEESSALSALEGRRQCLESAAAHFFKSGQPWCTREQLMEIADAYVLKIDRRDLVTFVLMELQNYSLLVCDPVTGILSFSHKSFHEYFLAGAILREVQAKGWRHDGLLCTERLDSGEAEFIGALLAEEEHKSELLALHDLLHQDSSFFPSTQRRNLAHIAVAEARRIGRAYFGEYAPLAGADLHDIDFSGIDFSDCNLQGADLHGVAAVGANFRRASMQRCTLTATNLAGSSLAETDLRGATLDYSTLTGIEHSTRRPRLAGASLRGINVRQSDASYLEYAVNTDPDGDEAWRSRCIRAIKRGIIDDSPAESLPETGDSNLSGRRWL